MHSYQHNIKTFNNATRFLTRVERSLYRDLIELYYDTEQPLQSVDFVRLCRQVMAHSDEEKDALKYVLSEFFILTGDVYTHNYCDEQIEKYKSGISAKAKAGIASAESKRQKSLQRIEQRTNKKEHDINICLTETNTCSTYVTNHEPLTNNQETIKSIGEKPSPTSKPKKEKVGLSIDDLVEKGVDKQVAVDWFAVRKDKRQMTLTSTALKSIESEAVSAGLTLDAAIRVSVGAGWAGFTAKWYRNREHGGTGSGYVVVNKQEALEQRNAEAARKALEQM